MPLSIPLSLLLDTLGISSPAGGLAPLVPREPGGLREAFIPGCLAVQNQEFSTLSSEEMLPGERQMAERQNVGPAFKTATAWVPASCRPALPRPHGT